MAKLTRLRPCQASGGVEAPMEALIKDIEFRGEFYKYHKKNDHPLVMPLHREDILIHLVRDPLEHLVSWSFSYMYRKNQQIPVEDIPKLANDLVLSMNKALVDNINNYRENVHDFEAHEGRKLEIQLEKVLEDPEYLIGELRKLFTVSGEDARAYREQFGQIKAGMMAAKSQDGIRINTFGDPHFWHNTLSADAINRFNTEFYGK